MINLGIVGFGTVGTGTTRILLKNRKLLRERTGLDIRLRKIADLDIKSDRGIRLTRALLTKKAEDIIGDPDIDILVELIGGTGVARKIVLNAIKKRKHVVTANKALLATHGREIFNAAARYGVQIGYEASVAGGIPIIKVVREGLVANRILSIYGIINGTSNYILTKMSEENAEFGDVLQDAQRLGYAEADPTFDIEGVDSAHKLSILASLAYGRQFTAKDVYTEGISSLSPMDIGFARELGCKVKLLAIAKEQGGRVQLRVHPTMIPEDFLISKVDGVFNAVYVKGDAVGETLYYGRGAGDMPTGSAVVSDIVHIASNCEDRTASGRPVAPVLKRTISVMRMEDVVSMYYFRFSVLDKPGVLSKISGILGKYNISIASVIQKGRRHGKAVPLVMLTHHARERDVIRALKTINILPVISRKTIVMRLEGK